MIVTTQSLLKRSHKLLCGHSYGWARPPPPNLKFTQLLFRTDSVESAGECPPIIYFISKTDIHVETHKVSTSIDSIWGGFHVLLHNLCHEEVHSTRSSCMAPEQVRKCSKLA